MKKALVTVVLAVFVMALAACSGTGENAYDEISAYNNDGNFEISFTPIKAYTRLTSR